METVSLLNQSKKYKLILFKITTVLIWKSWIVNIKDKQKLEEMWCGKKYKRTGRVVNICGFNSLFLCLY